MRLLAVFFADSSELGLVKRSNTIGLIGGILAHFAVLVRQMRGLNANTLGKNQFNAWTRRRFAAVDQSKEHEMGWSKRSIPTGLIERKRAGRFGGELAYRFGKSGCQGWQVRSAPARWGWGTVNDLNCDIGPTGK
jgi:hypothetical protein